MTYKISENLEKSKREEERCYSNQRIVSLEASQVLYAACTLRICRCPAKTASKSLLEMLQKHQYLLQKFLCIHRKFPAKIFDMKNIFFDLSMSQKATENDNGMIAISDEKKSKKFKQVVVVICSQSLLHSTTCETICNSNTKQIYSSIV